MLRVMLAVQAGLMGLDGLLSGNARGMREMRSWREKKLRERASAGDMANFEIKKQVLFSFNISIYLQISNSARGELKN